MKTAGLGVEEIRPAVVTIDLHRGHLDPERATLPLPAETAGAVVAANIVFLDRARARGIPVIHVVTEYRRREEISSNPFWAAIAETEATRGNILRHNLPGSAGTELMPGISRPGDVVIGFKRRYDCFLGTDLEFTLRNLGANTLLITGVNTNSCVVATTIVASTKDFACIVIEDCVDTVDGPEFHEGALEIVRRAFGWTSKSDAVVEMLREQGWMPRSEAMATHGMEGR